MSKRTVGFADGTTLDVDVPEGMKDEELIGKIKAQLPGMRVTEMNRTTGEDMTLATRAAASGIGDTAKFLNYATPMGFADLIASNIIPKPKTLSGQITGEDSDGFSFGNAPKALDAAGGWAADKLGFSKAVTPREQMADKVTAAMVGSMIPAVGLEAQAAKTAGTLIPKLPALGRVAWEGLSGGAGAYGAESTRQSGGSEGAQLGMGLLYGMAPNVLGSTLKNAATRAWSYLPWVKPTERASEMLQANTTNLPNAIRNIENAPPPTQRVNPTIGPPVPPQYHVQPTLAEQAGDTGLAALQRKRETTPIIDRRRANEQVRGHVADTVMGEGYPGAIPKLANDIAAQGERDLAQGVTNISPGALPTRVEQGIALGGDLNTSGRNAGTFGNAAADAADARRAAYRVPAIENPDPITLDQSLVDDIHAAATPYFAKWKGGVPRRVRAALSNFIDETGQLIPSNVDTTEIQNIIKRLRGYAGEAGPGGRNNPTEAEGINAIIDAIGGHVSSQFSPQRTAALDAADALRAREGQVFEQGPLAQAMGKGRYNEANVYPGEIPGAITKEGAEGGTIADQLTQAIGATGAENNFRMELRRIAQEGNVTPEALGNFDEIIQRFPRLRRDVRALRQVAADNAAFGETQLGKTLGVRNSQDASKKIGDLLKHPERGGWDELVDNVGTHGSQETIDGLRRGIGEYITRAGKEPAVDATGAAIPKNDLQLDAINKVLDRGGPVLTDEQRTVLTGIQKEMERAKFARTGGKVVFDPPGSRDLPIPNAKVARMANFARRFTNTNQMDKLIEEAILNPSEAINLLKRTPTGRWGRIARRARRSLVSASIASAPGEPEKEE